MYNKLLIRDDNVYLRNENELGEQSLRLLVPEKDTQQIIEQIHTSRYNGHLGMKKTIKKSRKTILLV